MEKLLTFFVMIYQFKKYFFAVPLVCISLVLWAGPLLAATDSNSLILRQQLITFLQSGEGIESISKSSPLAPVRETPIFAIASYYLLEDDIRLLETFYPRIAGIVLKRYQSAGFSDSGLFLGSSSGERNDEIYLSPYLNGLGNLEIYTLFLIASRLGKHSDALEFKIWQEELSKKITGTFYNYNRDCFFPINHRGKYRESYMPQELIPLILDPRLDDISRRRIFTTCVQGWKNSSQADPEDLFISSRFHRLLILDLLSNVEELNQPEYLGLLFSTASKLDSGQKPSSRRYWMDMFDERIEVGDRLLDRRPGIQALWHFSRLMAQKKILPKKEMALLVSEVDTLAMTMSGKYIDLETYSKTLSIINRLLARMSDLKSGLASGNDLWRTVDEFKWKKLSPRVRGILTQSLDISVKELMRSKAVLSEKLERGAGLAFRIHLPTEPILSGERIDFKASLQSNVNKHDIKRAYLQIAGFRWNTGNSEVVRIDSGGAAVTFSESFSLPPPTEPGIVELPLFLDFLCDGERIEIHQRKALSIKEAYEVFLNFPRGRKLRKTLPLNLVIRFNSINRIRGSVEGVFCDPLRSEPPMPAKFMVEAGSSTTELPIKVNGSGYIAPGNYPFSLRVYLSGRIISEFRDRLVMPLKWLHLGPLGDTEWIMENGLEYQDDLGIQREGSKGYPVRWQRVPLGAIGEDGEVLLKRFDGAGIESCCLLYTLLELPQDKKVFAKFETENISSLWINGTEVVSSSKPLGQTTPTKLRKGPNSVLIAARWTKDPSPVLFEIFDESGLPVSIIENGLSEIVTEYASLSGERPESVRSGRSPQSPQEIIFTLERGDCSSVYVIGSFNNWDPEATPMKEVKDGLWSAAIVLSPGKYSYKFLIDKKIRVTDPSTVLEEPDGFGGSNSVLVVN